MRSWKSFLHVIAVGVLASSAVGQAAKPAETNLETKADPNASTQQVNDRYMNDVLKSIAGHEDEPAEKVFKNIQIPWLKPTPAGRFLRIMNMGYSKALGVSCEHCHVTTFTVGTPPSALLLTGQTSG